MHIPPPGHIAQPHPDDRIVAIAEGEILIIEADSSTRLPLRRELDALVGSFTPEGSLPELPVVLLAPGSASPALWARALTAKPLVSGSLQFPAAGHAQWSPLRPLIGRLDDESFAACGRASHLLHWLEHNRYCGHCGRPARFDLKDRALHCSACGGISWPRISPAIIVSVIKNGKEILLGHSPRHAEGLYTVIAGFVEAGETLEEAVAREVREEVGVEIEDIRYVTSQSWPYPDALMLAFTASWASGEIQVDGEEITDAHWFGPDTLPLIPNPVSVARKLIDRFVEEYGI